MKWHSHHSKVWRRKDGALLAGAVALLLLASSCASPDIKVLAQPIANSPSARALLHSNKLTPESAALLKQRNLGAVYRSEPAEAIAILHQEFDSDGSAGQRLALIELCSDTGDRLAEEDPRAAAGYHLAAAELAFDAALSHAERARDPAAAAYDHSAGQVTKILFEVGHDWNETATIEGPWKSYRFRCRTEGESLLDPNFFDTIESADYLELVKYSIERFRQEGIGAAMVGHRDGTAERREAKPFLSPVGMTLPVNATLDFSRGGGVVALRLTDLTLKEDIVLRGRTLPMAADLTAPWAIQIKSDPDRKSGWKGMKHPDDYLARTGLFHLEPFREDQIPVVFVHGLMSNPEVWVDALNQLRADPKLRRRYQLLVYRYPTGFPIAYSLASLRTRMQQFQEKFDPDRSNPNMRRMVVIGHSMGGMLSNGLIRGSGDSLTKKLFTRPIDELDGFSERQKATLKELLIYEPNPDITRAILVAAPHRGSGIATNPIGSLGRKLIKFPTDLVTAEPLTEVEGMTEVGRYVVTHRPDSIYGLSPDAPIPVGILENPVRRGVVVHSIIGKHKPNKPLEESSDMVVPYLSAHLDEAVSELVIPGATHTSICHNQEALEEVRRILYLHAGAK